MYCNAEWWGAVQCSGVGDALWQTVKMLGFWDPGSFFHQLGPLGRVGLVVDMSVCLCVWCPLPMRFVLRPLIGPQVTRSDQGLWLVNLPSLPNLAPPLFLPKSPLAAAAVTTARRDKKKLKWFLFKFVSVLLSASVERVGVSRMRDFLNVLWPS